MSDETITTKWILEVASNYHYRNMACFSDGSFGDFRITHNQFKRELQEAFERGACGDTSYGQEKREEWRKTQEQVRPAYQEKIK